MFTEVLHISASQCVEGGYIFGQLWWTEYKYPDCRSLYAVNSFALTKKIQHTFLETGYTHMECDGVHATIEHAKKYAKVHSIGQWKGILTTARPNSRYNATRLQYSDVNDLKALVTTTISNKYFDNGGQTVYWCKVRSLCFKCNSD